MLRFVNMTWGRVSEVVDIGTVLIDNLDYKGRSIGEWIAMKRWDQVAKAIENPDQVELNMEGFIVGAAREIFSDLMIGAMGQLERGLMRSVFSPSNPLMNMLGMPTTWARRLGYDPYKGVTGSFKKFYGDYGIDEI